MNVLQFEFSVGAIWNEGGIHLVFAPLFFVVIVTAVYFDGGKRERENMA